MNLYFAHQCEHWDSVLGLVCYIVDYSGLKPVYRMNLLLKYADDTEDCHVVPGTNSSLIPDQLNNITHVPVLIASNLIQRSHNIMK